MCPRLSANYVSCCPPNMAQVSVWAGNLQFLQTAEKFFLTKKLQAELITPAAFSSLIFQPCKYGSSDISH